MKRVLIADDHALLAKGIAGLLRAEYDVIGLVSNGRQLVEEAMRQRPELVVLDISMPELNGIEAATQIHRALPQTKLVFVTQQVDPQYLRAAFRAGASAYVSKQSASDELLIAIRRAAVGLTYVTPALEALVGFAPVSELREEKRQRTDGLTARQREVLQLVAEGKTTRQISMALNISPKTVEFHKTALMNEIGLRTTAELTRYAIAHGIVSL
ncbi:response regulator [Terriglobus aquaticus]|uniref:Response regulator n=1 Tax=Terriglobus aquaticus TaxID=940139 RepID=A0ABW9KHT4_9BACT|nr:response regulator transcription factor [Terriglobus aquaticus]